MKHLAVFIFSVIGIYLFSSNKQREEQDIIYEIPDVVHEKVNEVLFSKKTQKPQEYVCLMLNEFDTTSLLFIKVDNNKDLIKISKSSNRVLIFNNYKVPILFYSDLRFSTIFNRKNGDGTFSTSMYNFGGFMIVFTGRFRAGKIVGFGETY